MEHLEGRQQPDGAAVPGTGFLDNPYNPDGLYDGILAPLPLFRLTLHPSCLSSNGLPDLEVSLCFWCRVRASVARLLYPFFSLPPAFPPDCCSIPARQPYSEASCSCVMVDSSHPSEPEPVKVKGPEPLTALSFPFYVLTNVKYGRNQPGTFRTRRLLRSPASVRRIRAEGSAPTRARELGWFRCLFPHPVFAADCKRSCMILCECLSRMLLRNKRKHSNQCYLGSSFIAQFSPPTMTPCTRCSCEHGCL